MTGCAPASEEAALPRLRELLDIVGPREAAALLAQLHADLMDCDRLIRIAAPIDDWATLRRASHNLVALSGTAGASCLQGLAQDLNLAAHAEDRAKARETAPLITDAVVALAALIDRITPSRGTR